MNKDHLPVTRQYNIRRAGQFAAVQTKSASQTMNDPTHSDFRFCILAVNLRHAVGTLTVIQNIGHRIIVVNTKLFLRLCSVHVIYEVPKISGVQVWNADAQVESGKT